MLEQRGKNLEDQFAVENHYTTHVMRGAKAKDAFPDWKKSAKS
jgi:hypothetical protein